MGFSELWPTNYELELAPIVLKLNENWTLVLTLRQYGYYVTCFKIWVKTTKDNFFILKVLLDEKKTTRKCTHHVNYDCEGFGKERMEWTRVEGWW